jgi:hypothetical protein
MAASVLRPTAGATILIWLLAVSVACDGKGVLQISNETGEPVQIATRYVSMKDAGLLRRPGHLAVGASLQITMAIAPQSEQSTHVRVSATTLQDDELIFCVDVVMVPEQAIATAEVAVQRGPIQCEP